MAWIVWSRVSRGAQGVGREYNSEMNEEQVKPQPNSLLVPGLVGAGVLFAAGMCTPMKVSVIVHLVLGIIYVILVQNLEPFLTRQTVWKGLVWGFGISLVAAILFWLGGNLYLARLDAIQRANLIEGYDELVILSFACAIFCGHLAVLGPFVVINAIARRFKRPRPRLPPEEDLGETPGWDEGKDKQG